jgi:hypothetical protein
MTFSLHSIARSLACAAAFVTSLASVPEHALANEIGVARLTPGGALDGTPTAPLEHRDPWRGTLTCPSGAARSPVRRDVIAQY